MSSTNGWSHTVGWVDYVRPACEQVLKSGRFPPNFKYSQKLATYKIGGVLRFELWRHGDELVCMKV